VAVGDLTGNGRWRLAAEGSTTRVRYDWTVFTTKRWMNALAPLLEPAFRWNHHQVMAEEGAGWRNISGFACSRMTPRQRDEGSERLAMLGIAPLTRRVGRYRVSTPALQAKEST
jgi:hypothetical protein